MIEGYTREAGVRSLERSIGKICRKAAKILVSGQAKSVAVTPENLKDYLGSPPLQGGCPPASG